jgi:hypothetical protein
MSGQQWTTVDTKKVKIPVDRFWKIRPGIKLRVER